MKETWDPNTPSEGPKPDPMSLPAASSPQLRAVTRILKRDKKALKNEERQVAKVKKARRKTKLAKASRKRNRN